MPPNLPQPQLVTAFSLDLTRIPGRTRTPGLHPSGFSNLKLQTPNQSWSSRLRPSPSRPAVSELLALFYRTWVAWGRRGGCPLGSKSVPSESTPSVCKQGECACGIIQRTRPETGCQVTFSFLQGSAPDSDLKERGGGGNLLFLRLCLHPSLSSLLPQFHGPCCFPDTRGRPQPQAQHWLFHSELFPLIVTGCSATSSEFF